MRCAVVGGTGWQGAGIATRLAKAGHVAVIGSRQAERARVLAANLPAHVGLDPKNFEGEENLEAVYRSEVVFVTVPITGHRDALLQIRPLVEGKLVVDVTSPVDPRNHLKNLWPAEGSATEEAQALLGEDAEVVGAFKSVSATMLLNHTMSPNSDILICGDDLQAKHRLSLLIREMGFVAYDVGKADAARTMEGLTQMLIFLNYAYHLNQPGLKIVELDQGMKILPDEELFRKK
jgi:8-hydroxy-5-deazaflavin:NADPH oxidoreductase